MPQQYTCPFCFEDYTRVTIQEHYGCGVEPLEPLEHPAMDEQPAQELESEDQPNAPAETLEIPEAPTKPAAKRGRKPKQP